MTETKTALWLRRDALLRELFRVLDPYPDGLHYKTAIDQVRPKIPPQGAESDPVASTPGQDKYENQLLWFTVDAVKAGWLVKNKGVWRLTDEGREAISTHSGPGALADAANEKYHAWLEKKNAGLAADGVASDRWDLARRALEALPAETWTSYTDLASLVGTNPSSVGWWLTEHDVKNGFRVLQANGSLYETHSKERLAEAGITLLANGRADPSQHVDVEVLRELLGVEGGSATRRAWLIRGSSVNGYNLVPTWLERGSCSLAASHLKALEPPVDRDELRRLVDADYAHTSYNARDEKVVEFDSFLNRMHDDDIVLTTSGGEIYLGAIAGPALYVKSSDDRSNLRRDVSWLNVDAPIDFSALPSSLQAKLSSQHTVVDLTSELPQLERLIAPFRDTAAAPTVIPVVEAILPDATSELAEQLLVDLSWLQECVDLLRDRRQLIFYGPPGTGKTYLAQAIAEHLAGRDGVKLVQFHPAYSYEDFFEGYRPVPSGDGSNSVGFKLSPGPFRRLVDLARENPGSPYVLIIDEINRANLAKVFGELYFLLEYRDRSIDLLYSAGDEAAFTLPKNVYIIGTMNTADRSIALVDAAMRRRFAFVELHPSLPPTAGVLARWLADNDLPEANARLLGRLNELIEDDDFKIGPSYFMRPSVYEPGGLERMWRTSILPLLEEHHYGESINVAKRYDLDKLLAYLDTAVTGPGDPPAETAAGTQ